MEHQEEGSTSAVEENDISIFRKVHAAAKLSRGRPLVKILYERSIRGPKGSGGVKRSLPRPHSAALSHSSPSSVILRSTIEDESNRNGEDDSLAEILNDDNDSLSDVLNSNKEALSSQMPDESKRDINGDREKNVHWTIHNSFQGYSNYSRMQIPNERLKINARPTHLSNEIRNYAEQCSVSSFYADYLSLDKLRPLTNNNAARNEAFRRRMDPVHTEHAISTISIAFSPDGRTLASTHGDHTVKISCCNTGALVRMLEGHPRTPWTVKYHPSKSNIVASGCLGHQVRIWDWNHPIHGTTGEHEKDFDDEYNYHERKGVCLKMIRLRNSIISLSFHPHGSILAIACGHTLHLWVYDNNEAQNNSNRSSQGQGPSLTQDEGEAEGRNSNNNHEGNNGQTVLHQIRYANNLRCVHFPPGGDTIIIGGVNPQVDVASNNETSYSLLLLDFDLEVALMSPTEFNYFQSTDPEDRRPKPSVEVLKNYRTFLPRALLYNDGGFDVSPDGKKLCGCADLWLPFGINSAAELIEREENEKIALMERSFSSVNADRVLTSIQDSRYQSDGTSAQSSESAGCPYNSPPRQGTLPSVSECQTPPNPIRPDPTSPPSPPGRRWVPTIGRRTNGRETNTESLPPRSAPKMQSSGGRYVPHVVVVSLDDQKNALGESTLGKVLEATPLESKASSVTCVKFSPSAEFCLIGYGVREQGESKYHPVNSLYRVRGGMAHVATMLSANDDVNIARFHPHSGVGFVYGTKQGRVRVLSPRPWNYYYD
mmetsp:Transcript_2569/g.4809  ORF Transcript_2569/g.4809 Transcript_2569/m.4809 type:complete len:768 (-) Transcript_2569:1037-3340(-)|eukprot:CAMPEP_0176494786 /NCGR_PEP_ID=MMETSP0200_2-20121128/10300_1 /TAXON_ID=947934 /ORGANISM="Chaetoceros sp., Strain GSL56" /LENGTH=767 /DNA_ID=CAMNT_0017892603 /DNA_START=23 /DNA_END=2326 /DNA_ORIENTATION=+